MSVPIVFTDFGELPLDDPPPDQGDAGPPQEGDDPEVAGPGVPPPYLTSEAEGTASGLLVVQGLLSVTKNEHVIVPFGRAIHRKTKGQDVVAVKRALSTYDSKAYPWQKHWSIEWGDAAHKAMQKFQHAHGIKATGDVGQPTIRALAPFFDLYGFKLYTGFDPKPSQETAIRNAIYSDCLWSYNHRGAWHYHQWRPIDGLHTPHKLPLNTDCSGGATDIYGWNHGPDINRNGWSGQGWTGTIALNHRIAASAWERGDPGLYGNAPDFEHVVLALGIKRDGVPLCWSNGSEGAPYLCAVNYRGFPDRYVTAFAA